MGRRSKLTQSKRTSLRERVKTRQARESVKKTGEKYTVDQLLDQVEECIDSFNYEVAQKFCQRALEMEPDNLRALETSGSLLMDLGDMDAAKHCFGRAIELSPETGHSKYMYMGQLLTDKDSAQCYQKGIELMKKQLEELESQSQEGACAKEESPISVRDISCAYCAIAEIYLTDACFDEEAETACKNNLEEAVKSDASNPEVYHLLASFYLSKDDKKSSEENIEKGLSLWLPQLRDQLKPDAENHDLVQTCPLSCPVRLNAVKILIELEKYEVASEILELLLDEDDSVVEVWYLLGWSNHLQGEDYKSTARYYLQKAQEVATKTFCEDEQLVAHIAELVEEIGPGEEDPEDGTEDNGDMDFISDSDEDEEKEESAKTNGHPQENMQH